MIEMKRKNISKFMVKTENIKLPVKFVLFSGLMFNGLVTPVEAKDLAIDTSKVLIRQPSEARLEAFRKLKDYKYGTETIQSETWIDRLLLRFFKWLSQFFGEGSGSGFDFRILAYIFIAAVFVFVVLKLLGVGIEGFWRKKNASAEIPYEALGEDINLIDFQENIEKTIAQKNYRLAVRLYYLKSLKELSDLQMIDWRINKTNRNYVYELKSPVIRADFEEITSQFEYAWYGDFPIDELLFGGIRERFITFSKQLK